MDWISEAGPPESINETPEPVGQPGTDLRGGVRVATWHEPLSGAAAEHEQRVAMHRLQQAAQESRLAGYYDGVEIDVDYTVVDERIVLPDDLFPPLPRVGWKAILLAVRSALLGVLYWWRKLDKIDEQAFDKVPR